MSNTTTTPADAVKKVIDYLPVTGPILYLRKPVYDFEAIAQSAIQAYLAQQIGSHKTYTEELKHQTRKALRIMETGCDWSYHVQDGQILRQCDEKYMSPIDAIHCGYRIECPDEGVKCDSSAYLASLPEGGPTDEEVRNIAAEAFSNRDNVVDRIEDVCDALRALFAADKARAVAADRRLIHSLQTELEAFRLNPEETAVQLVSTREQLVKALKDLAAKDAEIARVNESKQNIQADWDELINDADTLKAALADTCKVRDEWCAECTQARDKLATVGKMVSRLTGERETLRQRMAELEKDNKAAKELLCETCYCTIDQPEFTRNGWAFGISPQREVLEIEYRKWPLFPTAEEAVNDALAKRIAEEERP